MGRAGATFEGSLYGRDAAFSRAKEHAGMCETRSGQPLGGGGGGIRPLSSLGFPQKPAQRDRKKSWVLGGMGLSLNYLFSAGQNKFDYDLNRV